MAKTVINFKVDKEVKEEAQRLAKELGLTLSAIVNAQLHDLIRTRRLSVGVELKPTPYLERIIAQARADRKAGKNIGPMSGEEFIAHLESL